MCGIGTVYLACGERQIGRICAVSACDGGFDCTSPEIDVSDIDMVRVRMVVRLVRLVMVVRIMLVVMVVSIAMVTRWDQRYCA